LQWDGRVEVSGCALNFCILKNCYLDDLLFYCEVLLFDPPNFQSKGGNGCKGNPTSATAGGGGGYYGGGGGCVVTCLLHNFALCLNVSKYVSTGFLKHV
jgi:hypothetical protein